MFDKKGDGPASFFKRIGKTLLMSVLGVVVALVLLEVGLRIYSAIHLRKPSTGSIPSAKPIYSYELVSPDRHERISHVQGWIKLVYHPYLLYKNLPNQHTQLYHINALGLRGEEVAPNKGEGIYRIILTGNSAAFGVGSSSDRSSIPYLLQQKLNSHGGFSKRVEVLNAGVIGYSTAQESIYLQMELVDLDPDLIIAYNGYNDFILPAYKSMGCTEPLQDPQQTGYQSLFYELERTLIEHVNERHLSLSARAKAILTSIGRRTFAGRFLQEKLWGAALPSQFSPQRANAADFNSGVKPSSDELIPECVERIVDNYRQNLKMISELSVDWRVRSLLVVQPESSWKEPLSQEEEHSRRRMMTENPWYEKAVAEIYPSFLQAAREVAAEHKVGFLDLSRAFDSHRETLFLDLVHLNDSGNEIVAQALADHLLSGEWDVQR